MTNDTASMMQTAADLSDLLANPWGHPDSASAEHMHAAADGHKALRDYYRAEANEHMAAAVAALAKGGNASAVASARDRVFRGIRAQALAEAHDDVRAGLRGAAFIGTAEAVARVSMPSTDPEAVERYHNRALAFWQKRAQRSQNTYPTLRPYLAEIPFSDIRPSWNNRALAKSGNHARWSGKAATAATGEDGEAEGEDGDEDLL